jgi:hypothetical protein
MKQYAAVETRRVMLALVIGLVAAAVAAGSAFAGEITGNGGETAMRGNANSECGFSGLDDPDDDGFVHTQNWGQLSPEARAFLTSIGVTPGASCNGHLSPQK